MAAAGTGQRQARHYGLRTDRYTLAHFPDHDEWELFDLEADPKQLTSVYDDPDYSEIVEELKEELERLRVQYQVPEEDPV